ncbi:MAG: flagellar secretion chaperone FliS [Actinomycetota bacterium]|jgi:flagellar protein FliS|nr:flagellar secretion chaperone FliS [Actinomycetota bacterium]
MTTAAQLRSRYARESVTTASPVRLVTMLYDRLMKDLHEAEFAISMADPQSAHTALRHAQDIVHELSTSLDPGQWAGGAGLKSLYTWLTAQLIAANISKDASVVIGCREVIDPLHEAWHVAANAQPGAS